MRTHYELLGIERTADADAIKQAFRREIARYHPDKVVHLGAEFQQMAETRAAELTVAYKTLSDPALRRQYDAALSSDYRPPALDEITPSAPAPEAAPERRFASERADRDQILNRAIAARVLSTVEAAYGKCDTPAVRGFDLAVVPQARPGFLGKAPPRVLVRVVDVADAAAMTDSVSAASRARLHAGKAPVIALLFSRRIAAQTELSKGWTAVARRPDATADLTVIIVDVADWSCRLPPDCSNAARKLADQICVS